MTGHYHDGSLHALLESLLCAELPHFKVDSYEVGIAIPILW